MTCSLETPGPRQRVYDVGFIVAGVLETEGEPTALSIWAGDECLGATRCFAQRRFRLLARFAAPFDVEREVTLSLRAEFAAGEHEQLLAEVPIVVVPAQLATRPYGEVLTPDRSEVLHRENIYGSGPPVEAPSAEAVALVLAALPPRSSVLDVGCGAGAYGPALIAAGHAWLGAEVDPRCHEILARRGLPFRALAETDGRLPFAEGEFDAAIAVEVLEHIRDLEASISEIARVTRSRFLVSVPNLEVIPLFAPLGIVPWHLLELTHVNFFTRASLRATLEPHFRDVEVFTYGEHPVRTHDGLPVHVHLFALATK